MPCAAGEACKMPSSTPNPSAGLGCRACREGWVGLLDGIRGTMEEEHGNEVHRVCPTCASKMPAGCKRPRWANKGLGAVAWKRAKPSAGGKQTRTRLTQDQRMEVLHLLSRGKIHQMIADQSPVSEPPARSRRTRCCWRPKQARGRGAPRAIVQEIFQRCVTAVVFFVFFFFFTL